MKPSSGEHGVTRHGRRARWGWLLTTLALALALVGTAWANYRSAGEAVGALNRGQAEILEAAVRTGVARSGAREGGLLPWQGGGMPPGESAGAGRVRPRGGRGPDRAGAWRAEGDRVAIGAFEAALDSVLEDNAAGGLRFIGLMGPQGALVATSGSRAPDPLMIPRGRDRPILVQVTDRIRSYSAPAPPGPAFARPVLVLEFEPVVAEEMVARARRALAVSSIGAAVLMLAALVFWRLSQRFEATERRMLEQRRLSVLGEMSAVLAHEIRNPLASLKGHAQLLAERLGTGTAERAKAERVVAESLRMEALTSDLLDFARSGPLDVRPADPVALVRGSAEAAGAGEAVRVDDAGAPATWPLDEPRIRQVLMNLLSNAVQSSAGTAPQGSGTTPPVSGTAPPFSGTTSPEVRVGVEDGRLVIEVRDHGPGLPEGEAERIFDPFYTTRTTGTGLGLPVARRIVEAHGGSLRAENHAGGGAVFRLEIPGRG